MKSQYFFRICMAGFQNSWTFEKNSFPNHGHKDIKAKFYSTLFTVISTVDQNSLIQKPYPCNKKRNRFLSTHRSWTSRDNLVMGVNRFSLALVISDARSPDIKCSWKLIKRAVCTYTVHIGQHVFLLRDEFLSKTRLI